MTDKVIQFYVTLSSWVTNSLISIFLRYTSLLEWVKHYYCIFYIALLLHNMNRLLQLQCVFTWIWMDFWCDKINMTVDILIPKNILDGYNMWYLDMLWDVLEEHMFCVCVFVRWDVLKDMFDVRVFCWVRCSLRTCVLWVHVLWIRELWW